MQSSMSKGLKFFFIAFLASFFGLFALNIFQENLENYFYAQISQPFEEIVFVKISPKPQKPELDLQVKAAISVKLDEIGAEKIIFNENINQPFPIASLTKLMTAFVVLENYDLSKEIKITKESVSQEGDFGKLAIGRIYPVEYLLYPLLMESSNDAAFALANDYEGMNQDKFVELMNLASQKMNLENTRFFNPTGLEPEEDKITTQLNYSTANDLVKLTKELLKKPLIWEILSTPIYNFYGPELKNTNEFLFDESPDQRTKIIGGKTGYTEKAGGCLLLVLEDKKGSKFINVILGAQSVEARITEMQKLINWLTISQ